MWKVILTKQAQKDEKLLFRAGLLPRVDKILYQLKENPRELPFEKLLDKKLGCFSRRINIQHRLVYQIMENEKIVKIIRMWTHYPKFSS